MRDVGLGVKSPEKACDDPKCPFHGELSVRGQVFDGTVVSDKMTDTVVVLREFERKMIRGMLREKKAYDAFVAALGDKDAQVRMSAAWALGKLKDKRAVEPLASILKDKDEKVRVSAALALAKLGDKRAIEPLIEALKSKDKIGERYIKTEAALALRALTDQKLGDDYDKWKEWYEKGRGK